MGSQTAQLSGVGLHSGAHCNLHFIGVPHCEREFLVNPEVPGAGITFTFPEFQNKSIRDLLNLSRLSMRSTVLKVNSQFLNSGSGIVLRTPEHLFAALLFFTDQSMHIQSDGVEIPGLDGSALPYREALTILFPHCAKNISWQEYPSNLYWNHEWSYGRLSVKPAEKFRVHYILERPGLQQEFTLDSSIVAWNEILPARTFAFYEEWQSAYSKGLMQGADLSSGLLLAESRKQYTDILQNHPDWLAGNFPLLNQSNWRMEQEPVKHKILDLLGDLALNGLALPKLDIEICNGGHSIHHLLLDQLTRN